jgi:hypothetical protein
VIVRRAIPLILRPDPVKDTGRASYGDVIHQLPRDGGVRDCIVGRTNWIESRDRFHAMLLGITLEEFRRREENARQVLCSTDYGGLELATHAQNCIYTVHFSRLADALNRDVKVHDALAATFLGLSYQEFLDVTDADLKKRYKNVRQAVKPANFGFPGGMGAVKLVLQQRKQGPDTYASDGRRYKGLRFCVLLGARRCGERADGSPNKITEYKGKVYTPVCAECVRIAEDIRAKWFHQWPENVPYLGPGGFISKCVDEGQVIQTPDGAIQLPPGVIQQHKSGRLRGNVDFCSAANGFFQGLAGDGAKLALWRVVRETFDRTIRLPGGEPSPLWGCRFILFAHDELIVEGPAATVHLWAPRISAVMIAAMREFTPDVKVTAPCACAYRWYKAMEPAYLDPQTGGVHASDGPGRLLVPWSPDLKYAKE